MPKGSAKKPRKALEKSQGARVRPAELRKVGRGVAHAADVGESGPNSMRRREGQESSGGSKERDPRELVAVEMADTPPVGMDVDSESESEEEGMWHATVSAANKGFLAGSAHSAQRGERIRGLSVLFD